jgi:hypothetical protein
MDIAIVIFFVISVYIYISIYIAKGQGLWKNIEVYTPYWSERNFIYTSFYLFVLLIGVLWVSINSSRKNKFLRNKQSIILSIVLILFSFMIFCMSEGNTSIEELFVLGSILLGFLIYNFLIILATYDYSLKIFSFLPLALYTYIYIWIYQIKNNH